MIIKDLKFNLSPNMKINFEDDTTTYSIVVDVVAGFNTYGPSFPRLGGEQFEPYTFTMTTDAPDGFMFNWYLVTGPAAGGQRYVGYEDTTGSGMVQYKSYDITGLPLTPTTNPNNVTTIAGGTIVVNNGTASWTVTLKPDRSFNEGTEQLAVGITRWRPQGPFGDFGILEVLPYTFSSAATVEDTSFVQYPPTTVEYLIVGGGGGGGGTGWYSGYGGTAAGGGGGGGGVKTGNVTVTANVNYTLTVGSGGAGGFGFQDGTNGTGSSIAGSGITTISVSGGGGGAKGAYYVGGSSSYTGKNGSSGGGGSASGTIRGNGGTGISGQGYGGGYAGPWSFATWWPSGGGGGAGGGGGIPSSTTPGTGGAGRTSSIKGTAGLYGQGGPGNYSTRTYDARAPGTTGMGGMGGPANTSSDYTVYRAMAGAPGQIVIRYPLAYKAADYTGVAQYTEAAGYRIYTFYGLGTISWKGGLA